MWPGPNSWHVNPKVDATLNGQARSSTRIIDNGSQGRVAGESFAQASCPEHEPLCEGYESHKAKKMNEDGWNQWEMWPGPNPWHPNPAVDKTLNGQERSSTRIIDNGSQGRTAGESYAQQTPSIEPINGSCPGGFCDRRAPGTISAPLMAPVPPQSFSQQTPVNAGNDDDTRAGGAHPLAGSCDPNAPFCDRRAPGHNARAPTQSFTQKMETPALEGGEAEKIRWVQCGGRPCVERDGIRDVTSFGNNGGSDPAVRYPNWIIPSALA